MALSIYLRVAAPLILNANAFACLGNHFLENLPPKTFNLQLAFEEMVSEYWFQWRQLDV